MGSFEYFCVPPSISFRSWNVFSSIPKLWYSLTIPCVLLVVSDCSCPGVCAAPGTVSCGGAAAHQRVRGPGCLSASGGLSPPAAGAQPPGPTAACEAQRQPGWRALCPQGGLRAEEPAVGLCMCAQVSQGEPRAHTGPHAEMAVFWSALKGKPLCLSSSMMNSTEQL